MNNSKPIRAIARGLEVIDALNAQHSTPMRVLSERTGMPRATLLRILKTLDSAGWVYRYRGKGDYRLTSKVCQLGEHLLTMDRLAETAAPFLDRLHDDFPCTADIAVCAGLEMRILDSTRRDLPRRRKTNPGSVNAPVYCSALGQAYLAFCPPREKLAILEKLRAGVNACEMVDLDVRRLEALLAGVRSRGYAVIAPGQCEYHRSCGGDQHAIAVPVRPNGQVRASLGLSWVDDRDTSRRGPLEAVPTLVAAAQSIAEELRHVECP